MRLMIGIGATAGGLIGGYVPAIWGASPFSGWAILLSTIGGIIGVYLGVYFYKNYMG